MMLLLMIGLKFLVVLSVTRYVFDLSKIFIAKSGIVACAFNPRIWETKANGSLNLRLV